MKLELDSPKKAAKLVLVSAHGTAGSVAKK